jgi:hypothetical protein
VAWGNKIRAFFGRKDLLAALCGMAGIIGSLRKRAWNLLYVEPIDRPVGMTEMPDKAGSLSLRRACSRGCRWTGVVLVESLDARAGM